MNFEKILIVDDDVSGRRLLESYLRSQQFSVSSAGTLADGDRLLKQEFFDLLLLDLNLPDGNGVGLIGRALSIDAPPVVLVFSGNGSTESVIHCLRAGAFDYIEKPVSLEVLKAAIERAAAFRHGQHVRRYLEGELCCSREMIGDSAGIRHLRSLVTGVAAADTPVLISGERGTGKNDVAGMIHRASPRAKGPLVRVNCCAPEESQLENELFGRITETCEEGIGRRVLQGGRLELAHGGTLLLDEISEMPQCIQLKLLEALQNRSWVRAGSERPIALDVRVIATTQRDLAGCVARGTFSRELYQQLNGSLLHVPPLRERIADLPLLVADWLERLGMRWGGRPSGISEEALRHLMAYCWPGNLRELENVLERAAILGENGARMEAETFQWLTSRHGAAGGREGAAEHGAKRSPDALFPAAGSHAEPLLTLEEMEKRQVLRALEITNQNRTRAASLLKISVRTLRNKLHQYRAEDPSLVVTLSRNRHLPVVPPVAINQPAAEAGASV